jgi:hypothetical protein
MEQIVELLKEVNIAQIFIILLAGWVAYSRLDKKIDRLERKIEKIEDRMTKYENDMIEVKTILRMKECCMISDDRQSKKVE